MKRFMILIIAVLISQVASAQGWEQQTSPTTRDLWDVVFVDSLSGWAVGDWGIIVHTIDGGEVWTIQRSGPGEPLRGVDFVDASNGWAVGADIDAHCLILHTTDGGDTWTAQACSEDPVIRPALESVDFLNTDEGWVAGVAYRHPGECWGVRMHTTDGGETWTGAIGGSFVTFVDTDHGWISDCICIFDGGCDPSLGRTTDGGETWEDIESDTQFESMEFLDADNGWAVANWRILRTEDGGVTWASQDSGDWLTDLDFVDADHGWAIEWDGTILYTRNGGETWAVLESETQWDYLNAVSFVDTTHGWAVGAHGTILRYNPSLGAPDEHSSIRPSSFSLSTFPNPFNPSTTIVHDLPQAEHISLRVFDLLGREVEVLADGFAQAGTHRVTFDGGNLASGIYFARLEAGSFSQTRKLMLLK